MKYDDVYWSPTDEICLFSETCSKTRWHVVDMGELFHGFGEFELRYHEAKKKPLPQSIVIYVCRFDWANTLVGSPRLSQQVV